MMQVKMNARVFDTLVNQYRKNFPGYTLPDDAHAIGKSYARSGDDVSISEQLRNALVNNSPEYLGQDGAYCNKSIDVFIVEFV